MSRFEYATVDGWKRRYEYNDDGELIAFIAAPKEDTNNLEAVSELFVQDSNGEWKSLGQTVQSWSLFPDDGTQD